jgi:CDP-glucose 4,6-dehydratase
MALEAMLAGKHFMSFNFGPSGDSLTVEEVFRIATNEWDGRSEILIKAQTQTSAINLEASILELDSSLSREQLGWFPMWSQEEAVRSTISWWKNYFANESFSFEYMNGDFERLLE